MTRHHPFAIAGYILLLAACGRGDAGAALDNHGEMPAAPTNIVAPPPSSPTFPGQVDRAFMLGKWSAINEDCSEVLDFRDDGSVITPIGSARWTLDGDRMTIDHGEGSKPAVSTIKVLSPERIEVTVASGTKDTGVRC